MRSRSACVTATGESCCDCIKAASSAMVWKYKGVLGMAVFLSVIMLSISLPVVFVQTLPERLGSPPQRRFGHSPQQNRLSPDLYKNASLWRWYAGSSCHAD